MTTASTMITALTTAITNNTNINIQLQPFNAQPYPNDGMGGRCFRNTASRQSRSAV